MELAALELGGFVGPSTRAGGKAVHINKLQARQGGSRALLVLTCLKTKLRFCLQLRGEAQLPQH